MSLCVAVALGSARSTCLPSQVGAEGSLHIRGQAPILSLTGRCRLAQLSLHFAEAIEYLRCTLSAIIAMKTMYMRLIMRCLLGLLPVPTAMLRRVTSCESVRQPLRRVSC